MNLRLFIERNLTFVKCPNCNTEAALERVKSNNDFEKLFLVLFRLKKYHCKNCKWNGMKFMYAISRNYVKVILIYILILIIILILAYFINIYLKNRLSPHLAFLEFFNL